MLLASCTLLNKEGVGYIACYTIADARIPEGFDGVKIVFVSDFHYKSTLKENGLMVIIRQIQQQRPDLVLLGGDYTEGKNGIAYVDEFFGQLSVLRPPLGIYGVLGNHDDFNGREQTLRAMRQAGIGILDNQGFWLSKGGGRIRLIGTADLRFSTPDLTEALAGIGSNDFVILVSHQPDIVERYKPALRANLILSGHTHGGQVTYFDYAPKTSSLYGQKYRYGLKELPSGGRLIITSGIGTSLIGIRFGPPEEIVVVTLRASEGR
jgi:predicted MPP superfamily phosphohydrolase